MARKSEVVGPRCYTVFKKKKYYNDWLYHGHVFSLTPNTDGVVRPGNGKIFHCAITKKMAIS